MKFKVVVFLSLVISNISIAQDQIWFSNDPLEAKFVTEDVDRFWEAFEKLNEKGSQTFEEYILKGTPGLKGFIPYRIISADSLYSKVIRSKEKYIQSKGVLKDLGKKEKRIKAIYSTMKYWYPYSKFPPVYFVVGRFNSGGTISDAGIILGTEMQKDLEGLPALVAHELIDFQQRNEYKKHNLLSQSIVEGSADFIGELISGETVDSLAYYQYGRTNLKVLKTEFVQLMNGEELEDWMYGTSGKDDRPNDLGYWIGYEIVKSYFDKQEDKKQAIFDILAHSNQYQFLKESGYLNEELEIVADKQKLTLKEYLNKQIEE